MIESIKIILQLFGFSIIVGAGLATGIDLYQRVHKRTFISLALTLIPEKKRDHK